MKRIISVLLTLVMAFGLFSAMTVTGSAAINNTVPKRVSMSETGGAFSGSYSNGTLTYNANGTPIDHGIAYAFLTLSDAGVQNRNIAATLNNDEIKYAMSAACRSGKVRKIVIHNYVDHYNNSTDTFDITADEGKVIRIIHSNKRYYKGGMDSQQTTTGTFTYTYNDKGNLVKINWHAGNEAEKYVFEYDAQDRLKRSIFNVNDVDKDIRSKYTLDENGYVTKYGKFEYAFTADGLLTKANTWTYSYYDTGTLKTAVDHRVDGKACATFNYTYTNI